jgi:hypothetical protein
VNFAALTIQESKQSNHNKLLLFMIPRVHKLIPAYTRTSPKMRGITNSLRLCARRPVMLRSRLAIPVKVPSLATILQKQWTSSHCCSKKDTSKTPAPVSITSIAFWSSRAVWKRASVNTTRCLIGCTAGDFSAMWILQAYYPELSMGIIMPISSEPPTSCASIA